MGNRAAVAHLNTGFTEIPSTLKHTTLKEKTLHSVKSKGVHLIILALARKCHAPGALSMGVKKVSCLRSWTIILSSIPRSLTVVSQKSMLV